MASVAGDISEQLVATSVWSDHDLNEHGIPVYDVPFVSIGGGIGSFAMVNTLRIAGLTTDQIRVISDLQRPSQTYEYLASNSQIRTEHRLRSDSSSVIDCIWGWPGYALREAWSKKKPAPALQVLVEPVAADYYTPQAGQVYESLNREAARISWQHMVAPGVVRHIRRRDRGDYFVLYTPTAGTAATKRIAFRSRYVHLAVGYPGVRFLADLMHYRQQYNDYQRVVNAYEPHDHVYAEMRQRQCTVMVRGAGIVASRVLQRLIDDRDQHGAKTTIIHLFRSYASAPEGKSTFRRPAKKGWSYQGFNFPKASWGGQLRDQLEGLEGDARRDFIDAIGGTNTAPRKLWKTQLDRGEAEGFYLQARGTVHSVVPTPDSRQIRTVITGPNGLPSTQYDADFIIDATGLEANIEEHRLIDDLLTHGGAQKNVKGRLDVERDFQVRGTDNGDGRMYASGSMTLGGYYAGVDSFLGLQYAALRIHDNLAAAGFGERIGPMRSTTEWWKWARNMPI